MNKLAYINIKVKTWLSKRYQRYLINVFIFTDNTDPRVSCRQAPKQMQKYLSGSYGNLISQSGNTI